jgi:DNA-binding MarR family transcriptional regulator
MSIRALQAVRRLPLQGTHLPTNMRFILFLLADFANEEDEAWPNYATLELQSGMHRSTVIRAVNDLVERGLIQKSHRARNDGSQSSNTYHLTFIPKEDAEEALRTKRPSRAAMSHPGRTPRLTLLPSATPPTAQRDPMNDQVTITELKTPPTPPTPANDLTTSSPGMTTLGDDPEVRRALQAAERRRATRNAGSLLGQQHPLVWAALTDLQSIYTWKPTAFASIAEQILNLTRHHTDHRTELAIRTVIEAGATINHPIPYIRKLLTTNDTQPGTTTPRRSLRDGLTPLDSITLD